MKTKIITLIIIIISIFACNKPNESDKTETSDDVIARLSYKWNLYATSINDNYNYVDTSKRSSIMEFRKNMTFTFVDYNYITMANSTDTTLIDTTANGTWNLQNNNIVNLSYQTYIYTFAYDSNGYIIGIADTIIKDTTRQFTIEKLTTDNLVFSEQIYYPEEDIYFPGKYHLNKTFKE